MNTKFRKFIAATMTVCAICSIGVMGANAAGKVYDDGAYTAKLAVMNASSPTEPSMGRMVYDHDVEIDVADGQAAITFFVPYNEQIKTLAPTGALQALTVSVAGQSYQAVADFTGLEERCFEEPISAGGIIDIPGNTTMPSQAMTLTLPAEQLDAFTEGVTAQATVAFMGSVEQILVLSDIAKPTVQPTENSQKTLQLTANVAEVVVQPSYILSIPQSLDLGDLSATEDNIKTYEVGVTAENLGNGRVVITADAEGTLQSGNHSMKFTNNLEPLSTGVTATAEGTIVISAQEVAAAAAGNYQGTANFTCNYFAGK